MKKMKVLICMMFTSVLCFITVNLIAQDLIPKKNETTGKWGFVDKQEKVVIPFKYAIAGEFFEGLAVVAEDTKGGYIDKTGKIIIPLQYDGMFPFKNGLAIVAIEQKFGVIDKTGKIIIPCQFQRISTLGEEGFSVVQDNKMGYIDKNGIQKIPFEYSSLAIAEIGFLGMKDGNRFVIEIEK